MSVLVILLNNRFNLTILCGISFSQLMFGVILARLPRLSGILLRDVLEKNSKCHITGHPLSIMDYKITAIIIDSKTGFAFGYNH